MCLSSTKAHISYSKTEEYTYDAQKHHLFYTLVIPNVKNYRYCEIVHGVSRGEVLSSVTLGMFAKE